jgi:hypothetical protein
VGGGGVVQIMCVTTGNVGGWGYTLYFDEGGLRRRGANEARGSGGARGREGEREGERASEGWWWKVTWRRWSRVGWIPARRARSGAARQCKMVATLGPRGAGGDRVVGGPGVL